jgi:hypothetical protein
VHVPCSSGETDVLALDLAGLRNCQARLSSTMSVIRSLPNVEAEVAGHSIISGGDQ